MVMIVQGDANMFNGMVYGVERHPNTMQYLQNQVAQFSGPLTEFGQKFAMSAQSLFDQTNSSDALRMARAAIRRFDSMFLPDRIQTIQELGHLQNAPVAMQRWIMAQSDIRKLYHEQRCDGYSATYEDMWPTMRNLDHYDWRRIHDGVAREDENGGTFFEHWIGDHIEGDVVLSFADQCDILNTHDVIKAYVELGNEDPTDRHGNKL